MQWRKTLFLSLLLAVSIAFARPTLIIIDASGSMDYSMDDGTKRIDAAKMAAKEIVSSSSDEIALMVYNDCDWGGDPHSGAIWVDVEFTTDKARLTSAIDNIQPWASTPIARSLEEGSIYVASTGKQAGIVLLTDGEETCDSQSYAVEAASKAQQSGVVIVNIVGFQLDQYSQEQMAEIASAGKGNYYDAQDVDSLSVSLRQAYGSASGTADLFEMCCGPIAILLALAGLGIYVKGRRC